MITASVCFDQLNDYTEQQIFVLIIIEIFIWLWIHAEMVTVWCGLWADDIIGRYFFKDATKRNVTVDGELYRLIKSNIFFFWPK